MTVESIRTEWDAALVYTAVDPVDATVVECQESCLTWHDPEGCNETCCRVRIPVSARRSIDR